MQDTIVRYKEILGRIKSELTINELRNIHYKSVSNFLIYFKFLKGENETKIVFKLLNEYFDMLEEHQYQLTEKESKELTFDYIMQIGNHYSYQLNFKIIMSVGGSLFGGILIDSILFFLGVSKSFYFIPVATIYLLSSHFYKQFYYGKKNKLYGVRY